MKLKKLASVLIAAAVMALLCVVGAVTVYSEDTDPNNHDHGDGTWTEWTSNDSLPTEAGSYYLTEDVTLNLLKGSSYNYWTAPVGEYNLCLNGHTITVNYTMKIGSGSDFKIFDCQDECGGILIERNTSAELFYVLSGKLTVYNGNLESKYGSSAINQSNSDSVTTIEGGTVSGRTKGIHVSSGKVTVNRGNIEGSKDYQWSAGIECYGSNAELIVNDGNVSGSQDGIYVVRGKTTVNGGTVSGNTNAIQSNGTDITIKLSGNPTLNGDIYLTDGVKITIEDTLTNTAPYSIRMKSVGVFTGSSDTDLNAAANFEPAQTHKNAGYEVIKNSDGQLALSLKTYTVTYDCGEYGDIEEVTKTHGTSVELSSDKLTRTGYIHIGWATEEGGDKAYDFGAAYSDNADITLYPAWTECDHANESPVWTEKNDKTHSRICDKCGATVTKDHSFGDWNVTEDGKKHARTCDDCGESETKEHSFGNWNVTEDGENHTRTCDDCGASETKEHSFGEWSPCEDGENHTRSCTVCGAEETAEHSFGEWIYTEEDGENHTHSCTVCGAEEKAPHTEDDGEITKDATDTEDGEMTYKCKDCGYVMRTEPIPATGSGGANTPGAAPTPSTTTSAAETTKPADTDDTNSGNVIVDSSSGENAPNVSIDEKTAQALEEEVIACHLTEEEKEAVANGADLDIILSVEDAGDRVPAEDKLAAEAVMADSSYILGQYLNIDLLKLINGQQVGKITELNAPISITIEVPEALRGENRAYAIIRVHDGAAELLEDQDNDPNTITILTDRFSTYAIVYQETEGTNDSNHNTGVILIVAPFITSAAAVIASRKRK